MGYQIGHGARDWAEYVREYKLRSNDLNGMINTGIPITGTEWDNEAGLCMFLIPRKISPEEWEDGIYSIYRADHPDANIEAIYDLQGYQVGYFVVGELTEEDIE